MPDTPPTDAQVAAWLELAEAATPGPWDCTNYGLGVQRTGTVREDTYGPWPDGEVCILSDEFGENVRLMEDAKFIAAAREAVPALAREVQRLQAELGLAQANNARVNSAIGKAGAVCGEDHAAAIDRLREERDAALRELEDRSYPSPGYPNP